MSRSAVVAIGELRIKPRNQTTVRDARAAFGAPASLRPGESYECRGSWPSLGLKLVFWELGAGTACGTGQPQTARIYGAAGRMSFRLESGLRVGDSLRRLRRLHRHARRRGRAYVLKSVISKIGPGRHRMPIVSAVVKGRRVSSLKLWIGAAGE